MQTHTLHTKLRTAFIYPPPRNRINDSYNGVIQQGRKGLQIGRYFATGVTTDQDGVNNGIIELHIEKP